MLLPERRCVRLLAISYSTDHQQRYQHSDCQPICGLAGGRLPPKDSLERWGIRLWNACASTGWAERHNHLYACTNWYLDLYDHGKAELTCPRICIGGLRM